MSLAQETGVPKLNDKGCRDRREMDTDWRQTRDGYRLETDKRWIQTGDRQEMDRLETDERWIQT